VGSVQADKAPINARGPNLSLLDKRIRREWYGRWCYSPARIVPRMEMPSVQVPVRGVLGDNVHDQLAAVWHTLNTPGFEPPEPNPIRVLRLSGVPERKESPIILHDVVKDGDKTYLFPLVIGLPNRHNVLFDLETNRLAAWWLGDTARQRTRGKSWWWEVGGKSVFASGISDSEIEIWRQGRQEKIIPSGQFVSELLTYWPGARIPHAKVAAGVLVGTAVESKRPSPKYRVWHQFDEYSGERGSGLGFTRHISVAVKGDRPQVRLRLVSGEMAKTATWNAEKKTLMPRGEQGISLRVFHPPDAVWNGDGSVSLGAKSEENARRLESEDDPGTSWWTFEFKVDYTTSLVADQFPAPPAAPISVSASDVAIAPGFKGIRLPLPHDVMPSAFSWNDGGELIFTTLRGELLKAVDRDKDGVEDAAKLLLDGLAMPYGVYAEEGRIDVATKDGLLRIPTTGNVLAGQIERIAFGWGCTDDYHDWAVGLVRNQQRGYFLAIPCQQDERSEAAAKYRGKLLHLKPLQSDQDNQSYGIEVISSGHRFPMGLALNYEGELFVTDNQGNYNPFNELNHVRQDAHFGFINALEKENGYKPPPLTEPSISIPHPWTRSVNGICFLDTPADDTSPLEIRFDRSGAPYQVRGKPAKLMFGPLEGHLIGCEYDTRRLIRMTLQKIGDTYQGAAYPLSIPPDDVEKGLLGPIVCAVKPTTGELYIGEIRDSGWGAGNNVGQIVKIKIEPDKLPCGIAEMKATSDGFSLDFFQPVDATKAADVANYSLQSYRRESTPAYGGPDLDRRTEKIAAVEVSPDKKRVSLKLPELRERFVYELRLKNLAPKNGMFHPDEAHFTLRQVPK